MPPDQSFELMYNLSLIKIEPVGPHRYRVQFSNEVPAIIVEHTNVDANVQGHWIDLTSGNDELAAGIGHLIETHQTASK